MMKYLIIIFVIIHLVRTFPVKNIPLTSLEGQIDKLATHLIRCRRLPGLTIAVARATADGGRQVLTRSYGVADIATNRSVDVNTRFCLAGLTQCFTAATLTQLLHENKSFSLDSTIQSMLGSWFHLSDPSRTRRVTVRDILSHRVGLAPYFGGIVLGYNLTRIELIRRLRHIPVVASFRHSFVPNPLLYVLAGHLVQNFNDTFWENVVMRRIFKPLHMTGSTFADRVPNWSSNFALPHVLRDGQLVAISSKITGNILRPIGPSNSICSTGPDMAEWMLTLLRNGTSHGDPVLDPRVIHEMFDAQNEHLPSAGNKVKGTLPVNVTTDAYNLGWFSGTYRGHKRVFQNGFANFYGSFVTLFPDNGLGIFTAANGPSLTGMDNAFRALHYSIADLALGEMSWLNESTACTYPKPWITSQRKPVKTDIDETKPTKVGITTSVNAINDTLTQQQISSKESTDINNLTPTSESTVTSIVQDEFEQKKATTESIIKAKNKTGKTILWTKVTPKPLRHTLTIGNDVTSQSRLRTVQISPASDTKFIKQTENRSRSLIYVPSSSFRNNRTALSTPKSTIQSKLLTKPMSPTRFKSKTEGLKRINTSRIKPSLEFTTRNILTTHKPSVVPNIAKPSPKSSTITTTTEKLIATPISILPEIEDDDIEEIFDGTFGMRIPSTIEIDTDHSTQLPVTKSIKKLPSALPATQTQLKLSTIKPNLSSNRKHSSYSKPTSSLFASTRTSNLSPKTLAASVRANTIGGLQPSESILVLSTPQNPKFRPNWMRRNQSQITNRQKVSALDELVMKFITSTNPTTRITDAFNDFILTHQMSMIKDSLSTAMPKMDFSSSSTYFTDVSTSTRTPIEEFLLEDMETIMPPPPPTKVESVFTSGQFQIMQGTQSTKPNQEFTNTDRNNLRFHFPLSYHETMTAPTLKIPKKERLLFSSKRRLSQHNRQSRRSTFNYQPVTAVSLIEDDITETLLKFGVRLARRERLKREGKLSINPFPDYVATYTHPFFGNLVIFFNKTSGTLQMEYGFYGKAHLIPYVQSNTFLLRFFSAVWYVSESDDGKRLPRSIFLVYFKGSTTKGKPEQFIVPFFDPRKPPIFLRENSIDDL